MLTFRIKVQGCKPYEGIFTSSRAAMDAAFRLYPDARRLTVGPLQCQRPPAAPTAAPHSRLMAPTAPATRCAQCSPWPQPCFCCWWPLCWWEVDHACPAIRPDLPAQLVEL